MGNTIMSEASAWIISVDLGCFGISIAYSWKGSTHFGYMAQCEQIMAGINDFLIDTSEL